MTQVSILLDPAAAVFYQKLVNMVGIPFERVLADALFKLAGELSLEALQNVDL